MSSSIEFGAFSLPFPESFETLAATQLGKLKRWQGLLKALDDEERAVDDDALGSAWVDFRAEEPSKSAIPARAEHLVKPAGPPGAAVCLVLHYPSYFSKRPENGSVYDLTNPCTRRLAESGFDDKNSLWLDLFSRRRPTKAKDGSRFSPCKHAEPVLLEFHLQWLDTCLRTSTAKVVVMFGKPVEEYFKRIWGNRLGEMKLWGGHEDISLWMLYPEGDDFTQVERLVLFVWHPEYVGQREDIALGKQYDQVLGLAAQLAGISQSEEQSHFQEVSCTTPASLRRSLCAGVSAADKFRIMTRRMTKSKKGLTRSELPVGLACIECGYQRLDTTPYWYVPNKTHCLIGDCIYLACHGQCGTCEKDKTFHPIDEQIQWVSHTSTKEPNKLWRLLNARNFVDGPDLPVSVGSALLKGVVQEEASVTIPESEA